MLLDVPRLDRHRYEPVGLCIYCGDDAGLTEEHIMPFGLGGNVVLPASSCRRCAEATSGFERKVLRGPLRPIRVIRGIQSRRKHRDAPTKLPLQVSQDAETWETVWLPYDEYPFLVAFMVLDIPGFFDAEYESGIRVRGHLTYSFGDKPETVADRLAAKHLRLPSQRYHPRDFARLCA